MTTPFDPQPCDSGGGAAGDDTELKILCDANGTPFLRDFLYTSTGVVSSVTDTELDGLTPFVPVEPVGVCISGGSVPTPGQIRNQTAFVLCDNTATQFVRTYVRDGTGTLITVVDSTLTGGAFVAALPVGLCPEVISGTVSVVEPVTVDGAVTVSGGPVTVTGNVGITGQPIATTTTITGQPIGVTVTGQPISVTGTVAISGQPISVTISGQPISVTGTVTSTPVTPTVIAQHFEALPGSPWTPAQVTGVCTSVSYTVLTGTATVLDSNGTSIATIPAGFSATWDNGVEGTLTPPTSIASVGGRVIVHWTEK